MSERRALSHPGNPNIGSSTEPFNDAIADLNRKLANGAQTLRFDPQTGYLKALLDALELSEKSQLLVYSKTSLQASHINAANPRALYFSDDVALGFIRGAPLLELAVLDPKRGVQLYTLAQRESPKPQLTRGTDCIRCHESLASLDVTGMLLRSMPTASDGRTFPQLGNAVTDHRSPLEQRWGGWYVTGSVGRAEHMGNLLVTRTDDPDAKLTSDRIVNSVAGRFDWKGYPTPFSDVAALMVFEHQVHMTNLLVRLAWDSRTALALPDTGDNRKRTQELLESAAREFVDYMLFVDEAALPGSPGKSAFAAEFGSRGPFDRKGRSLRQLDLSRRLMRFPCSYMIYSPAFDALPAEMKAAIYERLWAVLSGSAEDPAYRKLSAADRSAVVEILLETKPGLPAFFKGVSPPNL